MWFLLPVTFPGWMPLVFTRMPHGVAASSSTTTGGVTALAAGTMAPEGLPLALTVVGVLGPMMEELVFHGCLLGGLPRHISFGRANLLQTTLFAALRRDAPHFLFLFLLATIAGWMTKKTKGLAVPVLLHPANNAIFVLTLTV